MSMNSYGAHDYGMLIPKPLLMEMFRSIAKDDFDLPDMTDEEFEKEVKLNLPDYFDALCDYGFAEALYNFEGTATSLKGLFPDGTDFESFPSYSDNFNYSCHCLYIPLEREISPFKAAYKDLDEMADEIYQKLTENYDISAFTKDDVANWLVRIDGVVVG